MRILRRALAALAIALALASCTGKSAPAASAAPGPVEGSPQITSSADDVHIEYQVYGHGDPAVVLVHGWANDAHYWSAQIDVLKAHYTVVTLNLAGHGTSARNRRDWSIANYAEDVVAVVHQIANRKVILVGHAMGAPVVLEAARRIGDRVIGIIAVDALKSIGEPPMSHQDFDALLQPFRTDFIGHMHQFVGAYLFRKDANPAFVAKVADDMALQSPPIAIASLESLYHFDFNSVLPAIKVPIIAINSDLNRATDAARIQKFAPTFRAVVLPDSGHFLMLEAPQRFNSLLLRELAALAQQ